jgi:hypothetical protein
VSKEQQESQTKCKEKSFLCHISHLKLSLDSDYHNRSTVNLLLKHSLTKIIIITIVRSIFIINRSLPFVRNSLTQLPLIIKIVSILLIYLEGKQDHFQHSPPYPGALCKFRHMKLSGVFFMMFLEKVRIHVPVLAITSFSLLFVLFHVFFFFYERMLLQITFFLFLSPSADKVLINRQLELTPNKIRRAANIVR